MNKKKCKSELDARTKEFIQCLYHLRKNKLDDFSEELTTGEFSALYNIYELIQTTGEETVRISEVGKRMKLSAQAISKTLRLIEKKGYLLRTTSAEDRRITLIQLTDSGKEILKKTREGIFTFARTVAERMGDENIEEFIRLGRKCTDIMDELSREIKCNGEKKNE